MYMYAGAFDQWCLLGWYNTQDRYFTDRMADAMRECVTVVQNWWSSLSSSLSSPAFNPHVTVSVSVPMQTSTSTSWEDEEKKEQGIWWRQLPHNLTELRMLVSKEHAL